MNAPSHTHVGYVALALLTGSTLPAALVGAAESQARNKHGLEEVIVTAQKREELAKDVPISMSVLTGGRLDKSSFTSVIDSLTTVPGVAALAGNGVGGGTQLIVRGVGAAQTIFNGSSTVGYYLDTVPFGRIRSATGPDQNVYDLDRIEVLRGPQGTLYGVNAENGLVRVLTRNADLDEFELKARTALSTTDGAGDVNYRGDMVVNVPLIEDTLAVRGVIGYQYLAGWIDGPIGNDLNDARMRNYRLKINGQPTDTLSIGLSAWINRSDLGALNRANDAGRITAVRPQKVVNDYDAYSLSVGYKLSDFSVTSMTGYLDYLGSGVIDLTAAGLQPLDSVLDSKALSQEVLVNSNSQRPWRWTGGLYYRDIEDGFYQNNLGGGPPFVYSERSKSFAVFGEVGRRFLSDQMEWVLGVRHFEDNIQHKQDAIALPPGATPYRSEESFDSTTPRAVLSWFPSSNLTVYGSYSQGFRSGLPLSYIDALAAPDFPAAKPDKLSSYEVGAKMELLDEGLSVDSAVYYIDWRDVQQTIAVPFRGTEVAGLLNGESASGVGVDLSMTARMFDDLELGITASWNDLRVDDDVRVGQNNDILFEKGDRLAFSPEYTLGGLIAYGFPLGRSGYQASMTASANYTSELSFVRRGAVRQVLSGDSILIGRAQFMIESPTSWTATFFVDNFNDENGQITGGALITPRPRPRTVGLQLEVQF